MRDLMVINAADNVGVVMRDAGRGEALEVPGGAPVEANEDISSGHKIALADIPAGGQVVKYGETIGTATAEIARGDWVHTHNME